MERVSQSVVRHIIARRQRRLLHILIVILEQTVICVHNGGLGDLVDGIVLNVSGYISGEITDFSQVICVHQGIAVNCLARGKDIPRCRI